jgi:hypothetical protein
MTYNPSTDTLTVANLTGLASNATQVRVQNTNANSTHYLTFDDTFMTGQKILQNTAGISCNPNADSITATTFNGALSGTATNATNTGITATATDALFFPTFVSATSGNLPQLVDSNFTYNPSNGDLSIPNTVKASGNIAVANSAFGLNAGLTSQGNFACAIGVNAGRVSQGASSVAVGNEAGENSQGSNSVAIGTLSAENSQGEKAVAVGFGSGQTSQGDFACAIGNLSGQTTQGAGSVSVGINSGNSAQRQNCVAIGNSAGMTNQGGVIIIGGAVAVGFGAGETNQGEQATAVGRDAGNDSQGASSVAIGVNAGQTNQGANAIAIGNSAGTLNQGSESIIINATGVAVQNTASNRFVVKPVRAVVSATPVMVYNTTTGEITHNTSSIKYKKNVIDLTEDTSSIYNVRAREYDAKDEDNKHYLGYIAEEINECNTNFTWKNEDGTAGGIEWFNLLIFTIEEMKKLRERIAVLEAK